jgi:hypothetical protein
MTKNVLVKSLARWAGKALAVGGEHCFELRSRFRIPGAGVVDLLSLRHTRDHFIVGLWGIQAGAIEEASIDAMTRRIHAFQAWYSELQEHAELQGFSSAHRISVCGNLVGSAVRRSPLVDLLSNWGSGLHFWTWKATARGALEVSPCYGRPPALAPARAQLKGLLHHLPWQDTGELEGERIDALRGAGETTPS